MSILVSDDIIMILYNHIIGWWVLYIIKAVFVYIKHFGQ